MKSAIIQALVVLGGVVLFGSTAHAQYCYGYVDTQVTNTPLECVREGDLDATCSWSTAGFGSCTPGDDCCTSIPDTVDTDQTVLDMHTEWHDCFGNTASNPPPGRSARWVAFHRQMELDFDIWRDASPCDPVSGEYLGCAIEYLPWREDMHFPYGQGPIGPGHPRGCGATGEQRPGFIELGSDDVADGVTCSECFPFPQCVTFGCDVSAPQTEPFSCTAGCPDGLPYTDLSQFTSVEEIGSVLDITLHGAMHGHVADPTGTGQYNQDSNNSSCSPRDPMFWRLHKALDETARAWQQTQPVDVTVVLDRSGSMGDQDSTGGTKMQVALDALQMFTDMLAEDNAESGFTNRVGVVSYGSDGSSEVPLQLAQDAQASIDSLSVGPGGCTSIGKGLEFGLQQLCPESVPPGSDETDATCFAAPVPDADTNPRRAMVLLTDGLENVAPCLEASDSGGQCGATCSGEQFDFQRLGITTELCAVGFGEEGASLNGPLLTLLAERQGGVYMETPDLGGGTFDDDEWIDLKDFFVKCLGTVTSSFQGVDPKGVLPGNELHTDAVDYAGCGDKKLTFASGWDSPDALRLMVNTPSGDLLRRDGSIGGSRTDTYEFDIVRLPYNGEQKGTWRSQLVRPHRSYVNGFTTDSLDMDVAVPLVRRQIQRLCPEGCDDVVYFEDGRLGPDSSYGLALQAELDSGLIASLTAITDPDEFELELQQQQWDLVVYAHQMTQGDTAAYDDELVTRLCSGQAAIVTETREVFLSGEFTYTAPADINACAGAMIASEFPQNFTELAGDGKLLDGIHQLDDHGYQRFSYTFGTGASYDQVAQVQSSFVGDVFLPAIVAEGLPDPGPIITIAGAVPQDPDAERWFINVLVDGPHRLEDSPMVGDLRTDGYGLLASFKILPPNMPTGGFDDVVATVAVERPLIGSGVGQVVQDNWSLDSTPSTTEDYAEGRPAAIAAAGGIPRVSVGPFLMNDDGVDGDIEPNNGHWSVQVPDEAIVDGSYKLHFEVDLTKDGCTMHREFFRTKFVEVQPHAPSTIVDLGTGPGGTGIVVDVDPTDQFGNPWGPGRGGDIECGPDPNCECSSIVDNNDGTYTVSIDTSEGTDRCHVILDDVPVSVSGDPACANDTEPPVIDVSEEVYISTCSTEVDAIYLETPEMTDNCTLDLEDRSGGHQGLVIESNGVPLEPPVVASHHGTFGLELGTHLVQWSSTDEWGNTSVAVQVVHVIPGISGGRDLLVRNGAELLNRDVGLASVANLGFGVTEIGVEAQVGSIDSMASVDLRDRAVVGGSVTSAGNISVGNDVEISGDQQPFASLTLPAAPDLSDVVMPPPSGGSHVANDGQTLSLEPGSYGTVILNSGSALHLEVGDYYFRSLTINSNVTSLIHHGGHTASGHHAAAPRIYIQNVFDYRSSFLTDHGELAHVEIVFLGNGWVVLEADLDAKLIAPGAGVSLGTATAEHFHGTYHARTLEVRPGAHVHCSIPQTLDFSLGESCHDGIQNGHELGVDCGGPCDPDAQYHDHGGGHDHDPGDPSACEQPSECTPATYQAEDMFHSTGGPTSGGWNLWSNGYVLTAHDFEPGQDVVEVIAKGTYAGWSWPHMVLEVGGQAVDDVFVSSPNWHVYSFELPEFAGMQDVRIRFDNDYQNPWQDRNLLLDAVNVTCGGSE